MSPRDIQLMVSICVIVVMLAIIMLKTKNQDD